VTKRGPGAEENIGTKNEEVTQGWRKSWTMWSSITFTPHQDCDGRCI